MRCLQTAELGWIFLARRASPVFSTQLTGRCLPGFRRSERMDYAAASSSRGLAGVRSTLRQSAFGDFSIRGEKGGAAGLEEVFGDHRQARSGARVSTDFCDGQAPV